MMSKLKPLGTGFIPRILTGLYAFIITCRNLWYDWIPWAVKKTGRYTVSIGGIHAGGTGKTPMAQLIGEYYQQKGYKIAFLSRGYRRKSKKPIIVKPGEQMSWEEIGDEPAMLHRAFPNSWLGIGSGRYRNAAIIGPQLRNKAVFILDDGFQHRKIFRNKNIVCLPPNPFNDHLLPAGYLREPISSLKRANLICIIGSRNEADTLEKIKTQLSEQYMTSSVFILCQSADKWVNTKTGLYSRRPQLKRPLLISGIAHPYRFIDIVRENGITPHNCVSYEDHHVFNSDEINDLCTSKIDGIITTEKDAIRLSTINLVNCTNIWYLKIKLEFFDDVSQRNFFSCFSCK